MPGRLGQILRPDLLDKDCALVPQLIHDQAIVDHLVAHVDGRAEYFQRAFDDLYGAIDAGAKTARTCECHMHGSWIIEISYWSRIMTKAAHEVQSSLKHNSYNFHVKNQVIPGQRMGEVHPYCSSRHLDHHPRNLAVSGDLESDHQP